MPLISIELLNTHKDRWTKLREALQYDIIDEGFGAYMDFTYNWRDGELAKIKEFDKAYEYIKEKYVKKEI